MAQSSVTPSVLKWARQSSGYSLEEAAEKFRRKSVDKWLIRNWETGDSQPTFGQIMRLSAIYKKPSAMFFFSEPPDEKSLEEEFNLDAHDSKKINPRIRHLFSKARARQIELWELEGEISSPIIQELSQTGSKDPEFFANRIRSITGVNSGHQAGWKNSEEAFKKWKAAIENLGVWVFLDPFGKHGLECCGFSVNHDKYNVIYINSRHSHERKVFTLLHGLGSFLLSKSAIDFQDTSFNLELDDEDKMFCVKFACDSLIALDEIEPLEDISNEEKISSLSAKYKIHQSIFCRQFYEKGVVSEREYKEKIACINKKYEKEIKDKNKNGGGNHYNHKWRYLGEKYIDLVIGKYRNGKIELEEAADYLDVTFKTLDILEGFPRSSKL